MPSGSSPKLLKDPITLKFCNWLIQQSQESSGIEKVTLFGSRARGDHHERSDFDLVINAPHWNHSDWSKWVETIKEKAPTLLALDLVWNEAITQPELLEKIKTEGIVLYEKRYFYDEKDALAIIERIRNQYIDAFSELIQSWGKTS